MVSGSNTTTKNVSIEWNGGTEGCSLLELVKAQVPEHEFQPSTIESLSITIKDGASCYNAMDVAALVPYLTKTATVHVETAAAATTTTTKNGNNNINNDDKNAVVIKNIHTSFLLAGLQSQSEKRQGNRIVLSACRRMDALHNAFKAAPIQISGSTSKDTGVVTLDNDDDDDDDDIIDEDALLQSDASNFIKPPSAMNDTATKQAAGDDCSGREPCADCTCGRAETSNNNKKGTSATIQTSSCGNCALGDAFRCANCPYLGKPAFKPGEEHLVLDLQDDL
ncbi:hypothetical protein ACA910_017505 [Epithemia clementina (nom. ined.)]